MNMPALFFRSAFYCGMPSSMTGALQTIYFDIEREQTAEGHGFDNTAAP
jgi:hypothetical protein